MSAIETDIKQSLCVQGAVPAVLNSFKCFPKKKTFLHFYEHKNYFFSVAKMVNKTLDSYNIL